MAIDQTIQSFEEREGVEVISPKALRARMANRTTRASNQYS